MEEEVRTGSGRIRKGFSFLIMRVMRVLMFRIEVCIAGARWWYGEKGLGGMRGW